MLFRGHAPDFKKRMPSENGTPEGTRTPHLLLRRQLLYPDELLAHMERVMGIEPTPTAWKAVVLAVILHPHDQAAASAIK